MTKGSRNIFVQLQSGRQLPFEKASKEQLNTLPRIITNKRGQIIKQISVNDIKTMNNTLGVRL